MPRKKSLSEQLKIIKDQESELQKQIKQIEEKQALKAGQLLKKWYKKNFKEVSIETIKLEAKRIFG